MSDASYEQFRRDGGLHDVEFNVDILNYSIDAEEELLIENYSGAPGDLSDRVIEVAAQEFDEGEPSPGQVMSWLAANGRPDVTAAEAADEYEGNLGAGMPWPEALDAALIDATDDPLAEREYVIDNLATADPARVEAVRERLGDELRAGHWVTIADGSIEELSEFHPFRVHVEAR